jgi:hypothetical protein
VKRSPATARQEQRRDYHQAADQLLNARAVRGLQIGQVGA